MLDETTLSELYVERGRDRGIAGNIYKGKVVRVLPGMQAAFVDIGLEKAAFLHVSDLAGADARPPRWSRSRTTSTDERRGRPAPPPRAARAHRGAAAEGRGAARPGLQGADRHQGRARHGRTSRCPAAISCSCPARGHVGISRRIEDPEERDRLRDTVEAERPARGRLHRAHRLPRASPRARSTTTSASSRGSGPASSKTAADAASPGAHPPGPRPGPALRARPLHDRRRAALDRHGGGLRSACSSSSRPRCRSSTSRVHHYQGATPIFDQHGIETKITRALERRVWLKSGGYLIIDQTESLTDDRRQHRAATSARTSQEETILRTNLEAGEAGRHAAPPAQHRRHHRHRLHRHGRRPRAGAQVFEALQAGDARRQGAHQHPAHLRARAGADDAQADAREPGTAREHGVPPLRRGRTRAVRRDPRLRGAPPGAARGRDPRRQQLAGAACAPRGGRVSRGRGRGEPVRARGIDSVARSRSNPLRISRPATPR